MTGKRSIRSICCCAAAGLALALGGTVCGQYQSTMECLDASPAGVPLTGQDEFYLPTGVDSVDYLVYTYAGNALGLSQNPNGGLQFIGGVGPAGGVYARGQRDITWAVTGQWVISFDVAWLYLGAPPSADYLGSFSNRLDTGGTGSGLIHLFSWMDAANPTNTKVTYMAFDSGGVQFAAPGQSPGPPEWQNLLLNHWYHLETLVDFDLNKILEVSITDLTTGQTATAQPVDWYLAGGAAGPANRTGFRFFGGGGVADNCTAFDNPYIGPPPTCPEDINNDDVVDVLDLLAVLAAWGNACGPEDVNGDGLVDVLDLLAVLAAWGPC